MGLPARAVPSAAGPGLGQRCAASGRAAHGGGLLAVRRPAGGQPGWRRRRGPRQFGAGVLSARRLPPCWRRRCAAAAMCTAGVSPAVEGKTPGGSDPPGGSGSERRRGPAERRKMRWRTVRPVRTGGGGQGGLWRSLRSLRAVKAAGILGAAPFSTPEVCLAVSK